METVQKGISTTRGKTAYAQPGNSLCERVKEASQQRTHATPYPKERKNGKNRDKLAENTVKKTVQMNRLIVILKEKAHE